MYDEKFLHDFYLDASSGKADVEEKAKNVRYWLRKNGLDVAQTNTAVTMGGGSSDKAVAAWNFFISGSAGDYYELRYGADQTNFRILRGFYAY